MDKIVFFNMNQLGDLLFALPAVKAAKSGGGKSAEVFCVVKSALSPLLTASGLIDGFIPKEPSFFNLVKNLKKEAFNKAVLFSESPFSLMSAFAAGIRERIGFETASLSFLLTKKSKRIGVPSIYNNFGLAKTAGFEDIPKDYCGILKIPEENISNVDKWFKEKSAGGALAIAPCSSGKRKEKRLLPQKWAQIIDALCGEGAKCVLSGAKWEKGELNEIAGFCKKRPEIFAAENGILDSAAFYKKSRLFIGIDSGAMHLAAAAGTKCIAVFISTDPSQTGPLPKENHIVIRKSLSETVTPWDFLRHIDRANNK
jgi:ADP-heptose:LPS heptosyltransferase